jgi:hypothetical protein
LSKFKLLLHFLALIIYKKKYFDPAFWKYEGAQAKIVVYYPRNEIKSCEKSPLPRPTAARLSSGSVADFLTRKDLADLLLETFARFSRR